MRYTIVLTSVAEKRGFTQPAHTTIEGGSKMVLNENELLLIGDDVEKVASELGGHIMTHSEVINFIKNK